MAAATRFRSDSGARHAVLLLLALLYAPILAAADSKPFTAQSGGTQSPGFVVELEVHDAAELRDVIDRVERLFGSDGFPAGDPVVLVLHGNEAEIFTRKNYARYRDTVDAAARLDAFGVMDVRICSQWMTSHEVLRADLPAFIEPVPYGPAEVNRLRSQGYTRF